MQQKIAQIFSYIFHPLLIPIYAVFITFVFPILHFQRLNITLILIVLAIVIVIGLILPVLTFYFLKKSGRISSFYMEKQNERKLPYMIMIFSYAIITFLLEKVPFVLPIFPVIFINGAIIILFVLLFNNFFKISAHLAALGSLFMYLYMFSYRLQMDLLWWILGILLISGVVAVSRLVLNAHTKLQVYSGFFLGAFVTFGILKLLFVR